MLAELPAPSPAIKNLVKYRMDPTSTDPTSTESLTTLLKRVVTAYSQDPLEKSATAALVSRKEMREALFRLPEGSIPEDKLEIVTRGIVGAGIALPDEEVPIATIARETVKGLIRLFGEAMIVTDFFTLDEDDRNRILAIMFHEVRVHVGGQPEIQAEEAAPNLPRRMRPRFTWWAIELMVMLAVIVIKVPTAMIMQAGSYRADKVGTMAIMEAVDLLPTWVLISCILDPLLTAAVQFFASMLGSATRRKESGERAAEVEERLQQHEGLLKQVEERLQQQWGGPAPANP